MLFLLLGCPKGTDTDESATPESPWSLDAAQIGDSMLLGAWEHDGELVLVGGNLTTGGGDMLRWDGDALCRHAFLTEEPLWWAHSDGLTLALVGEKGTVWIGGERRDVDTEHTLFGAWVDGEELMVVGGDVASNTGSIWRWTGTEWEGLVTDAPGLVFKVYDDHIVGDGVAWRWDGSTLTEVANTNRLVTVFEDMAVGGAQGPVVVEWDGSAWAEQDTTWLGQPVNGVHIEDGVPWVSGMFGAMAYRDSGGWQIPDFPLTSEHFHTVRAFEGEVWFVGGNFLSGGTYGTLARYSETNPEPRSLLLSECEALR